MTQQTRSLIFTLLTLLVLGVSLTRPLIARADEGTPTEAPAPAQDTPVAPGEAATAADPAVTALPPDAPTDVSATQEATTVVPGAADVPVDSPAAEPTSLPQVLDQAPQATDIVVLNQAGDPEPLATQAAAAIIQNGDPMWCPQGVTVANSTDCVNAGTVANLITLLSTKSGAGIVYFTPTYSTNDVTFDGTDSNLAGLTDLTLQGGWDGVTSGTISYSGGSVFSVPISVINWANDVAVNDITVDGGPATGLTVTSAGNITLHDVTSRNHSGGGAFLNNRGGSGAITLTGSNEFNDNGNLGLTAYSHGNISLSDLTADGDYSGAWLDNCDWNGSACNGSGYVTLTGTDELNNNQFYGLHIISPGNISLANVTASHNGDDGAYLDNTRGSGAILLTGANEFDDNRNRGLYAVSNGNISLSDLIADGNGPFGAYLDNTGGSGSIIVTGTHEFNDNANAGLAARSNGDIALNDLTVNGNGYDGATLTNSGGSGSITLTGTNDFSDNGGSGLVVYSLGNISLTNITADRNLDFFGVWLENCAWNGSACGASGGSIKLNGTNEVSNNGSDGMSIFSSGDVSLPNVTANYNASNGLKSYTSSSVTVGCSTFKNNDSYGVNADASTLDLNTDTFAANTLGDYTNTGSVAVTSSANCNPTPTPTPTPAPGGDEGGNGSSEGNSGGYRLIPVTGSGLANLDCSGVLGVTLDLAAGDRVILYCPVDGQGSASTTPAAQLPAAVSQGTLVSALTFSVVGEGGIPQSTLGSGAAVSFVLPEGGLADDYAILYWDTTAADGTGAWVELHNGPLRDPSDDKFVKDAGSKTGNGDFEARINFTGTFALVKK